MNSLRLIISGRVQGVGFRWFVHKEARKRGVTGYAKNLHDDTVEVAAFGEKEALEELLIHCRQGPRSARVNEVHVEWSGADAAPGEFEMR